MAIHARTFGAPMSFKIAAREAFKKGVLAAKPLLLEPMMTIQVTVPEMMHVWTVDNPRGPYAQALDEAWVRGYHAGHGR